MDTAYGPERLVTTLRGLNDEYMFQTLCQSYSGPAYPGVISCYFSETWDMTPLPRFNSVTDARCRLFKANTS